MDLPTLSDINEFNRTLIFLQQLSDGKKGCVVRTLRDFSGALALGGQIIDHSHAIATAIVAGLIRLDKGRVSMTENGTEFLQRNSENQYELTGSQKVFLARKLLINDAWKPTLRTLFASFIPNYTAITYELELLNVPSFGKFGHAIRLMRHLTVVEEQNRFLRVRPDFVADVRNLLANRVELSQQALEASLIANRKLGEQAELAVVEFEKTRLAGVKCVPEATLVRRVSQLNAGAGYDIESFNASTKSLKYNRFIEVKASQDAEIRFFITNNELQTALAKKNQYWIYFIPNFRSAGGKSIHPIMINNPAATIFRLRKLTATPWTYQVKANKKTKLKAMRSGTLSYYVI